MLKRAVRTCFLLLSMAFLVTGCAGSLSVTAEDFAQTPVPPYHQIAGIPLIKQEEYFCGPAALTAILRYHGGTETQDILAEQVFNAQQEGTFQHDMLYALRSRGLIAAPINNLHDAIIEIAHNNPVLIFENLALSWVPKWHYAVLSGYNLAKQELYFHGGREKLDTMPFSTFGHTWGRAGYWGYVVTKPPRLPQTTDTYTLDDLAPRFETLNQLSAAELTYQALIERPPQRSQPYFGLGNVYLAQQRYAEAENAYRDGLGLDVQNNLIINNLAYALAGQKRTIEACAFLNTALRRNSANTNTQAMLADSRKELCVLPASLEEIDESKGAGDLR